MKEITVVVFSKDRAFQLHECIRSLRQHARVVETCALRVRICVVWTASSPSCENAFRKVLRRLLAPALSKVHRPRDRTRVDARGGPGACRAATGTDTGTDTTGTDTTGTDTDTGASMKSSAGTGADAGADVGADAGADAGVGAGAGVGVGVGAGGEGDTCARTEQGCCVAKHGALLGKSERPPYDEHEHVLGSVAESATPATSTHEDMAAPPTPYRLKRPEFSIRFMHERTGGGFRTTLWSAVSAATSFVMFLVDDALFVRDFRLDLPLHLLQQHPHLACFQLKMGAHVWFSHPASAIARAPTLHGVGRAHPGASTWARWDDAAMAFALRQGSYDWNYPWDLCGSVYRAGGVVALLTALEAGSGPDAQGRSEVGGCIVVLCCAVLCCAVLCCAVFRVARGGDASRGTDPLSRLLGVAGTTHPNKLEFRGARLAAGRGASLLCASPRQLSPNSKPTPHGTAAHVACYVTAALVVVTVNKVQSVYNNPVYVSYPCLCLFLFWLCHQQ